VDLWQEQQAHAPEHVVHEEELARVEAIGQVAGRDRADEVEHAHQRERACCARRREPVVDRVGDEVLPDHAVGSGAADKERAGEEPELRPADGASHDPGVGSRCDGRGAFRQAEGPEADGTGILAQQEQCRHRRGGDEHCHDDDRGPPRIRTRKGCEHREEDELAGARRSAEDADDQAPMLEEPAIRDDGAERACEQPGAEAGDDAEQQHQVPDLARQRRQAHSGGGQQECADRQPPDAESVDQRARGRAAQAEQDEAQGAGDRDLARGPARVGLDGEEERPWCRPRARAEEDERERDRDHHPAVEQPPADRHDWTSSPGQVSDRR
jgi:hypothetical protein